MIEVFYREDARQEARLLINRCHYSHNAPKGIVYCGTWHEKGGLFGNRGPTIAAVIFIPPVGGHADSLFRSTDMLELKRLVRDDEKQCPPLTGLIAKACKRLKELGLAELLISYADVGQEHHGGVYQASSWNYNGFRKPSKSNYLLINGKKVGTRGLNNMYGTQVMAKIQVRMPSSIIEQYKDSGKYMYWRALSKKGSQLAKDLGFTSLPYPKPRIDSISTHAGV